VQSSVTRLLNTSSPEQLGKLAASLIVFTTLLDMGAAEAEMAHQKTVCIATGKVEDFRAQVVGLSRSQNWST
jgi:hypothetical protein